MNDSLRGLQRPTLLLEPPGAVDWRLSDIAVDWAREVAGYDLYDWQEWLVRWTFARRVDGLWAARDVGVEVARQNGKNVWLEVVELVSLCEFGDRLITHSAHRADVSHEHFLSLRERIEGSDELMGLMPRSRLNNGFITTNGNESIAFASGSRLLFKARAHASGRGPRPQKIAFDEALVLGHAQVGSMAPSIVAQRNPQLLFASSPPMAGSEVLHGLRRRAVQPEAGDRLFYAGWNNPAGTVAAPDREACARANPSLGLGRITVESLMANRKLMSEEEFLREHMGVAEEPADEVVVIPWDVWESLRDPNSEIDGSTLAALDVSPDRKWASFGVAGRRRDGLVHVEAWRQPGTDWVLDRAADLHVRHGCAIRVEASSPAAGFVSRLLESGVPVEEVSTGEHARACALLIDWANGGLLRHLGQGPLDLALKGAVLRSSGDASVWGRRTSRLDISPLVAVTLAAGAVPAPTHAARVAIVLGR